MVGCLFSAQKTQGGLHDIPERKEGKKEGRKKVKEGETGKKEEGRKKGR